MNNSELELQARICLVEKVCRLATRMAHDYKPYPFSDVRFLVALAASFGASSKDPDGLWHVRARRGFEKQRDPKSMVDIDDLDWLWNGVLESIGESDGDVIAWFARDEEIVRGLCGLVGLNYDASIVPV